MLKRVEIVEDRTTDRAQSLKLSDKISHRAKVHQVLNALSITWTFQVIFGAGDYYKAVTMTANRHFVQAASHQVLVAVDLSLLKPRLQWSYMSSNILFQQHTCPAKKRPCLQCTDMTSNIHVQWTNESARCHDSTILYCFESRCRGIIVRENTL